MRSITYALKSTSLDLASDCASFQLSKPRWQTKRGAAMFYGMERLDDLLWLFRWMRLMFIHDPSAIDDLIVC